MGFETSNWISWELNKSFPPPSVEEMRCQQLLEAEQCRRQLTDSPGKHSCLREADISVRDL